MSEQSNCAIAVIGIDIGKNSFSRRIEKWDSHSGTKRAGSVDDLCAIED